MLSQTRGGNEYQTRSRSIARNQLPFRPGLLTSHYLRSLVPGCDFTITFFFLPSWRARCSHVGNLVCTFPIVFTRFSFSLFLFPFFPSTLSRSSGSGTMGRHDRWTRDDSVQRGVRNFHARTSRTRAGSRQPPRRTQGGVGVVACRYHRGCIVYV